MTPTNGKNYRKFIGYVRVSSTEQATRKLSIPSQIEQITRYSEQNDIILLRIYKEEHSAYKGNRKVFKQVLDELKKNNEIDWLLIFKRDRVSRNLDDFNTLENITKAKTQDVVSVTEPMLNSYLWRYMIRDMQNRSILYSEELSFRVKLWIRKKLQQWWNIWWIPPFGFKRVNWYLVADDKKAEIVKFVFQQYSTGQYWFSTIANKVRETFGMNKFYSKRVETMIKNTLYIGIKTTKRTLSNEEYIFRGLDAPWTIYEQYEMNYVKILVSKKIFDLCQQIRKKNDLIWKRRQGTAKYPKIFSCSCGRNLRRDDKKNLMYLSCPKKITNLHPMKCDEWYIQIKKISDSLEVIIKEILLTNTIRNKMIRSIQNKMQTDDKNQKTKISNCLSKIQKYNDKVWAITESFVDWKISKEIYEKTANTIQSKIDYNKSEISILEKNENYISSWKKTISFINVLSHYNRLLSIKKGNKKSSHLFWILFKMVANLNISSGFVNSHKCFTPFNILEKTGSGDWWVRRDSNPRPWA